MPDAPAALIASIAGGARLVAPARAVDGRQEFALAVTFVDLATAERGAPMSTTQQHVAHPVRESGAAGGLSKTPTLPSARNGSVAPS
jgi:hypothetical protein